MARVSKSNSKAKTKTRAKNYLSESYNSRERNQEKEMKRSEEKELREVLKRKDKEQVLSASIILSACAGFVLLATFFMLDFVNPIISIIQVAVNYANQLDNLALQLNKSQSPQQFGQSQSLQFYRPEAP